jgi:hypothetical protein
VNLIQAALIANSSITADITADITNPSNFRKQSND